MFIFSDFSYKKINTLNQYYHPRPITPHLDGHRQHENNEVLDLTHVSKASST